MKHWTWAGQAFHFRRIVSSILVFCMMFSFCALVSAGPAPTPAAAIEVGSVAGARGDTVSVPVYLDPGSHEVIYYKIRLEFDFNVLEVSSSNPVTDQTSTDPDFDSFDYETTSSGIVKVEFSGGLATTITQKQQVFTINFKIKPGAASGDSIVTIDYYQIQDDNAQILTAQTKTGKVTVTVNTAPTASAVSIAGTAKAGYELTGNYTYADANDDEEGATTFQWYAADDASGTNKAAIPGATNETFVPTFAQQGKYITFEVTPVALTGETTGTAVSSAAVGPVSMNTVTVAIGSVSGAVGQTVDVPVSVTAASPGVGAYGMQIDFDKNALEVASIRQESGGELFGTNYSNTGGSLTVAWADASGGDSPIAAGRKLFTVTFKIKDTATLGDKALTVATEDATHFTFTDPAAVEMDKTLNQGKVTVTLPVNTAPTASDVSITGTAKAGYELTGNYTYTDADDDEEGATTFQWYAADDANGTNKAAIAGATNGTFVLTSAQQGKYITFNVTPVALTGETTGTAVSSAAVGPVSMNTVAVAIGSVSGAVGQTVDVPVSLTAASPGVGAYNMQIDFDKNALEVASIRQESGGELFGTHFSNFDGWLAVAWADAAGGDHPIAAGQKLFTVTFKIKDTATLGDKALTVATEDKTHFTFTDPATIEMGKTLNTGKVTVTPYVPSSNPKPSDSSGIRVIVNGKEQEQIATGATTQEDGKTVLTVTVDTAKLTAQLAKEGDKPVIVIPVTTSGADKVSAVLTGDAVKALENKMAILELQTPNGKYKLPAAQIDIDRLVAQFGGKVNLSEIVVHVDIAISNDAAAKLAESAAEKGKFSIVVPPVDFTVTASYNGKTVEVNKFSSYVEREIPLPEGVNPNKITTGVVVEQDGTVRHVPTKVIVINGTSYASINSLTNSTYTVVWHPLEFLDVANHWAKAAVNDMGSRMVIEGTGEGLFSPDRDITRAEFAAVLVRGLGLKMENSSAEFSDVNTSNWFSSAINTAYAYKLISGYEDGTFRPNDKITREQAMTILARAMKITGLKATLSAQSEDATLQAYADASNVSNWAHSSAADSVQAGLVSGRSATELAPKAFITRAEVATIIQRLLQKSDLI
ncbi:cohesin domain-containing protein [Cohnella soli]|uniref:Cohesin domain-containing protein n=1 Tax=Cohnella soli TaxID=425005 RepID=A0ABW0HWB3_9BACL